MARNDDTDRVCTVGEPDRTTGTWLSYGGGQLAVAGRPARRNATERGPHEARERRTAGRDRQSVDGFETTVEVFLERLANTRRCRAHSERAVSLSVLPAQQLRHPV